MARNYINKRSVLLLLLLAMTIFSSYLHRGTGSSRGDLAQILKSGELIVITRNAYSSYYEAADGISGLEYELMQNFADFLGVEARYLLIDSPAAILKAMSAGRGDIAAAGLTRTSEREANYRFGPEYFATWQTVVVHKDILPAVKDLAGLAALKGVIVAGSNHADLMEKLKSEGNALDFYTTDTLSIEQILGKIAAKKNDYTVVDKNIFDLNRRYYPVLRDAFPLSESDQYAWILGIQSDSLKAALEVWHQTIRENGWLDLLIDKYYGHTGDFDYVDLRTFHRRIEDRLHCCIDWFKEAEEKYGVPWTLLAAQAYQESHWNPNAVSPTGVRGIMMLTLRTAAQIGVQNRLDPYQSIMGGALYLSKLLRQLPASIDGEDRIKFALAAYNVGMSHIYDARQIARNLNKNPDQWRDMKTVLPLLSQRKYYSKTRHGYARGYEPVIYVERITNYRHILEQHLQMIP
jgi:membrane-bound lytic murein transglycosylase F